MDRNGLIKAAFEARKNAYAPYSNFKVGAALLCDDGSVVKGANIENASYGATICAERSAVCSAVSSGKRSFSAIAVVGGDASETDLLGGYAMPCGICRQVLREFSDPDAFTVIVARSLTDSREYTLSAILPESFGPDNLK
ncbi:MAG: cytidine deaminase [Lachnospiraceae bacterium]|nr:cytidine deaminase [Lachnospiraceae bacterium]